MRAGPRGRPSARSAPWPTSSDLAVEELAAGHRARGGRRDGPGRARGDRRARRRPARAGAGRVRRRGPAARRGDRRRAGHDDGDRAACVGGVLSALGLAVSERRRDLVESVLLSGDELTAEAVAGRGRAAGRARARRARRARTPRCAPTYELRYAGPGVRAAGRGRPRARARRAARGLRRRARGALRLPRPRRAAGAGDGARGGRAARLGARAGHRAARPSGAGTRSRALRRRGAGRGRAGRPGPPRSTARRCSSCPARRWWCRPAGRRTADGEAVVMERHEHLDPIELQVMLGALRAACDEMGVVLVRSAHSANIKERRDASTALFDARRADGHAGRAHPGPPGRDAERGGGGAGRGAGARRRLDPERPVPGRHAPARHHRGLPRLPRGRAAGLRRQPRPPRRRGRARAGLHARRLAHARRRGRGDRAHPPGPRRRARPRAARRPDLADAQPAASARPTCAPSWPPTAPAPTACWRWRERIGRRTPCARVRRRRWTTPSGAPARGSPSWTTASATATDVLEAREGDLELRLTATVARRRDDAGLHRLGRPARGQPELPAGRDPVGLLLRAARADRPRRAAVRRRLPAAGGDRPRGLPAQRAPRRPPWPAATWRPPRAWPTWCWPRSATRSGQGTMNNFTLGNDDFTYYETLGGGQGACADADGPSAVHVAMSQHAEHADRGAGAGVPAARGRVRGAARLRRRRARTAAATAWCASSRRWSRCATR